jgi:HEAT repeat protein
LVAVAAGCDTGGKVGQREFNQLQKIVETGLSIDDDPFVRAETARVLGLMGNSPFVDRLDSLARDDAAMVRVAAVEALMRVDPKEGQRQMMVRFNEGTESERIALVDVALKHAEPKAQRELLWRAIQDSHGRALRLHAFREGLMPMVDAALKDGRRSHVEQLFVPKMAQYLDRRDPVLAGPVLELMLRLEQTDRADPLVEELQNRGASLTKRLRAARILREARAQSAEPAYRAILNRADVRNMGTRLALPEKSVDKKLVRAAVLGLAALGHEGVVDQAKAYMKNASVAEYIDVLEALSAHPSDAARLSLKLAMVDARAPLRHRAIELYSGREGASVEPLIDVLTDQNFDNGERATRGVVAKALVEEFDQEWVPRLRNRLSSQEGVEPALDLLAAMMERAEGAGPVEALKETLMGIAGGRGSEAATAKAASLLVALADQPEVTDVIRDVDHVRARYAFLEHLVRTDPEAHLDYLFRHFYIQDRSLNYYGIRLMSGAGLWLARGSEMAEVTER